jgi:hypothetical protein
MPTNRAITNAGRGVVKLCRTSFPLRPDVKPLKPQLLLLEFQARFTTLLFTTFAETSADF